MSAPSTLPGLFNPVDDAQAVFRAALEALSRPGIPVPLTALPSPLPVTGFSQGMLALALTLCDGDTKLWLDVAADTPEARHHLRFHCASPFVENPSEASFAFIAQAENMPRLDAFNRGRADFPDRSATLIIDTNFCKCKCHKNIRELTGPGVKNGEQGKWQSFHSPNMPARFWEDWERNHASYPLGVDIIFVETGADSSGAPQARLLGLPRTARVREVVGPSASPEHAACT